MDRPFYCNRPIDVARPTTQARPTAARSTPHAQFRTSRAALPESPAPHQSCRGHQDLRLRHSAHTTIAFAVPHIQRRLALLHPNDHVVTPSLAPLSSRRPNYAVSLVSLPITV
ncbi:hypothetical protein B0H19DRAFT_1270802 [Mycena capillaripes]|nr:hypothetical protein B0H19DRAFT_1270802 [Mycena capillaripes]